MSAWAPDEIVGLTASVANIIVARQEHIPEVLRMLSSGYHRAAALGYEQWWDPFRPLTVLRSPSHHLVYGSFRLRE